MNQSPTSCPPAGALIEWARPTIEADPGDLAALDDLALIGLVAADDEAALAVLYERHGSTAFGLALRITHDRSLAEDAVQDAFLAVWRNARSHDMSRGGVRTWIMAIVHYRSIDVVRRRRPVSELPGDGPAPANLVQPDIWPEISGILDRDAITQALGTLGSAQRQVIEMAYFAGLTQTEIARQTGAPLGTVKSRARHGLLALRAAMASETAPRRIAGTDQPGRSGRHRAIEPSPNGGPTRSPIERQSWIATR